MQKKGVASRSDRPVIRSFQSTESTESTDEIAKRRASQRDDAAVPSCVGGDRYYRLAPPRLFGVGDFGAVANDNPIEVPEANDGPVASEAQGLAFHPAGLLALIQHSGTLGPQGALAPLVFILDPKELKDLFVDPSKMKGAIVPSSELRKILIDPGAKPARAAPASAPAPAREQGPAASAEPQKPVSRAATEIARLDPPPADHPMMRLQAQTREALAARGLSTTAEGVEILAVGEDPFIQDQTRTHGGSVARAIAGPVGLAQGATVRLYDPAYRTMPKERTGPLLAVLHGERRERMAQGHASLREAVERGVGGMIWDIVRYRLEIEKARSKLPIPDDRRTRIVTFSTGVSPAMLAGQLAVVVMRSPPFSRLKADFEARIGHEPRTNDDYLLVRNVIIQDILADLETPSTAAEISSARKDLATEVRLAREEGIAIFASSGNDYFEGARLEAVLHGTCGIPGIMTVGSVDTGDPATTEDDKVADFSNPGAAVCAPGVRWPVGSPGPNEGSSLPSDVNGTSFSSPYIASVAALMIHENPALTPYDIDEILLDPRVTRHVPGIGMARDGAGYVDAVAAVELARERADAGKERP